MPPEDIPLGWYTHLNFAFALINPTTFRVEAMDAHTAALYTRVTRLKQRDSKLKIWIGKDISCSLRLRCYFTLSYQLTFASYWWVGNE